MNNNDSNDTISDSSKQHAFLCEKDKDITHPSFSPAKHTIVDTATAALVM